MNKKILLISSLDDPVMHHFRRWLEDNTSANYIYLAQDDFLNGWGISWSDDQCLIYVGKKRISVLEFSGIYARLAGPSSSKSRVEWERFELIASFLDNAPITVVNRPFLLRSNLSKPFQQMIISKSGLPTPKTLITNDANSAISFWNKQRSVIYKSTSSIRSIARELNRDDDPMETLSNCPTQFQERLMGDDVRVHVIGGKVFPVRIKSKRVDYRYADVEEKRPAYRVTRLPSYVRKKCISITNKLNLELAGIDLLHASDGKYYCLEVNPSPGYSSYEKKCNLEISSTIFKRLTKGTLEA